MTSPQAGHVTWVIIILIAEENTQGEKKIGNKPRLRIYWLRRYY
jgi:hypothetical protein